MVNNLQSPGQNLYNSIQHFSMHAIALYPIISPSMLLIITSTSILNFLKTTHMEFFNKAKEVRLKSHHSKYLIAEDDEETVRQSRNGGSSGNARWTVEFDPHDSHIIRLKSIYGKYLTASNDPFLLGMTGKKVVQEMLPSTSSNTNSIDWEPRTDGFCVKLRTKGGKYLRANGGAPPWRNSVTHGIPHRTLTQDWILWSVDVVDILDFSNGGFMLTNSSLSSSFRSDSKYFGSELRLQSNRSSLERSFERIV